MVLLREAREKAGLSQIQLAKLARIPQQTISAIESGVRKNPGIETMIPIAKTLGLTLDELCKPNDAYGERTG